MSTGDQRRATSAAAGRAPMIRVFGSVGVDAEDGPVSIGGPRQRRLLALLAIRVGTVVDIDWLAEYLWHDDDRPDATDRAIRTYVSRLRQALPDEAQEWLETVPAGYRLAAPSDAVEHQRFDSLRARSATARQSEDPLSAIALLDEALGLWRGQPFRELEDLEWARAEIEKLELDRLEMLEERWEAALALGRHTQITGELAAFTTEHRHRDRAARQYALALFRSGQTAEALRVLADFRRRLAEESGLDPTSELVELERAMLADDPSLRVAQVGRPLRGYRLIEEAGAGAFSVVWRAEQPSVQREVAIKQIRAELASQPDFIRRFEAEAHLVARLEHPHIVPLIDYWRDPDSAYLVMRWLPGGTLERRLDDGPLTLDDTLALASQIGGALAAAHARGVIHRDVKTANILFDDDANAFLADFGIALQAAASAGPEAALSPGSPLYASPEQLRRDPLGPAADVFSLGVVVYECLTGSVPFAAVGTPDEVLDRRLTSPIPALDSHDHIPRHVADAVAVATAHDPAERFASVAEFVTALGSSAPAAATLGPEDRPSPTNLENPYVGLRAFDDGDVDHFFGRDRLVAGVVARLRGDGVGSRGIVVVGPSGSGKSSVVRAGVVPALRSGAVEGSDEWFVTRMVPGNDAYESLEAALLRVAVNPPPTLLDQLRDGPRGVLRSVRRCLAADAQQLLLVIDQFEELFATDHAEEFLDALAVAIDDPTSPLRLIATLRADYYDRPLGHREFAPILASGAIDVTPLAADELERAIVGPVEQLGLTIEPGLVARIAAESLSLPAPLPLLQYTLSELFDRRDPATTVLTTAGYDELGGLSGALASRSEAIYESAGDDRRAAIRRVFGRLTDPSASSPDVRRRVPLADFTGDPAAKWAIDEYTAARLMTRDRDVATREPTIEVAHEALFREWPRLVRWLDEDRDLLRVTAAIARAASDWETGGRDDADLYRGERLAGAVELDADARRRLRPIDNEFVDASRSAAEADSRAEQTRVRRLRRLALGTAVALVVALVAGAVALGQQRRADDEAQAALAAAAEAEAQTQLALEARDDADVATLISRSAAQAPDDAQLSLLLALEAHRRAPGPETERAVLGALTAGNVARLVSSYPRLLADFRCDTSLLTSDGLFEYSVVDGELFSQDLTTGEVVDYGPKPTAEPCGAWLADPLQNLRWMGGFGTTRHLGPLDGDWEVELEVAEGTDILGRNFGENRLLLISGSPASATFRLVDATTGDPIGDPVADMRIAGLPIAALSPDYAVVTGEIEDEGDGDPKSLAVVLDARSGLEVGRIDTPDVPQAVAFDQATGDLVVAMRGGAIGTFDLPTGELMSEVQSTATAPFDTVGVRPDGLIIASSAGRIELIDRITGPTGESLDLRDTRGARIRPDGTVLVVHADRYDIYDFDTSGLVERSRSYDPDALVNIEAGSAGIVHDDGQIEVIELASGDRTEISLVDPAGDVFTPDGIQPIADGLLAFTFSGDVSRWVDGRRIEAISTLDEPGSVSDGGAGFDAIDGVAFILRADLTQEVVLVNTQPGRLGVELRVDVEGDLGTAYPTGDGGVHVMSDDGTLRTYDSSGQITFELDTGHPGLYTATSDREVGGDGTLVFGGRSAVIVVDPTTGETTEITDAGEVASVGFARGGDLVIVAATDGTVQLWDPDDQRLIGVLWDGTGTRHQNTPWYDEAADAVWVSSSGQLVQLPVDPARWVARACELVGRGFTQLEWDQLVPGDGTVQSACDEA